MNNRIITSIVIPNAVLSIGKQAFSGCSAITTLNLGTGVRSIGYGAFENCSSLTSIDVPDSVTSLGERAFNGCTELESVELGENVTTIPTIGFNVETVEYKNINFTVWDVGGQDKIRALWRHYFLGTQGLIFVVDSNDHDPERIFAAHDELHKMLAEEELRNASVLILANKQDLPQAMSVSEMTERLGLRDVNNHYKQLVPFLVMVFMKVLIGLPTTFPLKY